MIRISALCMQSWQPGLSPVIGVHPRGTVNDREMLRLGGLLDRPEVVGLGEVGIDRTEPASRWINQLNKLERLLYYLQPRHILVLHCRGLKEVWDGDEAVTSVRHVLQGHLNVSKDKLIHLHCFSGTWPVVQRWFPKQLFWVYESCGRIQL